jgi:hypothetical protein
LRWVLYLLSIANSSLRCHSVLHTTPFVRQLPMTRSGRWRAARQRMREEEDENKRMAMGEEIAPRSFPIAVSAEEVGVLLQKARIQDVWLLHMKDEVCVLSPFRARWCWRELAGAVWRGRALTSGRAEGGDEVWVGGARALAPAERRLRWVGGGAASTSRTRWS